jgi:flagellin-like protein
MKNLRRSKKGVSDVIAVLLMIAIAVAASLIAYAWVMGYLGGTTNKVGNAINIQSMYYSGATLYVYVQNVGSSPVTLGTVYVNGVQDPSALFSNNSPSLPVNATSTVQTVLPSGFSPTNPVTVKVVCSDGTFMQASQVVPGS